MAAERIHLSVAEAREHSERAMRGIGYDAEGAHILAGHMIDAAPCGYEYSAASSDRGDIRVGSLTANREAPANRRQSAGDGNAAPAARQGIN